MSESKKGPGALRAPNWAQEKAGLKGPALLGENNPFFGKTHTEEIKDLLSQLNTGEGNPNYGKKRSFPRGDTRGASPPSLETVNKIIAESQHRAKEVFCYTWDDRLYICSYPSTNQMSKELNLVRGTIQYCIRNKTPLKTSNGKYFVSFTKLDVV